MGEIRLDDSAPLYEQVRRAIEAEIASGRLRPGDRVPSEPKLCRRFGVSQITVRRAMRELAGAGLVIRRSGLGSFVTERPAAGRPREAGAVGFVYAPHSDGSLPPELARLAGELTWAAGDGGLALVPARGGAAVTAVLGRAASRSPAGLVLAPGIDPGAGAPGGSNLVAIDPARSGVAPAEVLLERFSAGREAALYLVRLGHRAVGFVGCPCPGGGEPVADGREARHIEGVLEALDISGLSLAPERCASPGDVEGLRRILSGPRRATGVVCSSDAAAARLVALAGREGARVPERLSVVGHDGALSGVPMWPALTTVAYDWKGIAAAAVELLAKGGGVETFAGSLEVNETTGRPGEGA